MSSVDFAMGSILTTGLSRVILAELDRPRGASGADNPEGEVALALYLLKRSIPPPLCSLVDTFFDGGNKLDEGGSKELGDGGRRNRFGETTAPSPLVVVSRLVPLSTLVSELWEADICGGQRSIGSVMMQRLCIRRQRAANWCTDGWNTYGTLDLESVAQLLQLGPATDVVICDLSTKNATNPTN
jgi:hypothetical protein